MNSIEKIIDAHFKAINASTIIEQSEALNEAYLENVSFYDPFFVILGRERLSPIYFGLQEKFPGQKFYQVGLAEYHNNSARVHWKLSNEDGVPTHTGIDILLFQDEKISTVYVYIDGHDYKNDINYETHK